MNASKNPTKWAKSKHIFEHCFRALSPFMKNMLSVGLNAAQVSPTIEATTNVKIPVLNPYGLLFGGLLLLIMVYFQECIQQS